MNEIFVSVYKWKTDEAIISNLQLSASNVVFSGTSVYTLSLSTEILPKTWYKIKFQFSSIATPTLPVVSNHVIMRTKGDNNMLID